MQLHKKLLVEPGSKVRLSKIDSSYTGDFEDKDQAKTPLDKNLEKLGKLQYKLYAENKRSVLIVLQGMDAAGKDGTIRVVTSGLNPQGCRVTPFKKPTENELQRDYLWRVHQNVPPRGEIGIFNRSHYEDVLIVRVHGLVPESVWERRYDHINAFEKLLADEGTTIVKFFLHISKEEQKERFEARLGDPTKLWKFNPADVAERERWDDYQEAYADALSKCSTDHAPWYVVPADKKWFRNYAISEILVRTLEGMKMKFPEATVDPETVRIP